MIYMFFYTVISSLHLYAVHSVAVQKQIFTIHVYISSSRLPPQKLNIEIIQSCIEQIVHTGHNDCVVTGNILSRRGCGCEGAYQISCYSCGKTTRGSVWAQETLTPQRNYSNCSKFFVLSFIYYCDNTSKHFPWHVQQPLQVSLSIVKLQSEGCGFILEWNRLGTWISNC